MGTDNSIDRRSSKDDRVCAIYVITNVINSKRYVGKSIDPKRRWNGHRGCARRGDLRRLYCSIRKHGEKCFTFAVLSWHDNEQLAYLEEARLVFEWRLCDPSQGYNLKLGGRVDCTPSDEVRKLMSERMTLYNSFP